MVYVPTLLVFPVDFIRLTSNRKGYGTGIVYYIGFLLQGCVAEGEGGKESMQCCIVSRWFADKTRKCMEESLKHM